MPESDVRSVMSPLSAPAISKAQTELRHLELLIVWLIAITLTVSRTQADDFSRHCLSTGTGNSLEKRTFCLSKKVADEILLHIAFRTNERGSHDVVSQKSATRRKDMRIYILKRKDKEKRKKRKREKEKKRAD